MVVVVVVVGEGGARGGLPRVAVSAIVTVLRACGHAGGCVRRLRQPHGVARGVRSARRPPAAPGCARSVPQRAQRRARRVCVRGRKRAPLGSHVPRRCCNRCERCAGSARVSKRAHALVCARAHPFRSWAHGTAARGGARSCVRRVANWRRGSRGECALAARDGVPRTDRSAHLVGGRPRESEGVDRNGGVGGR